MKGNYRHLDWTTHKLLLGLRILCFYEKIITL